MEMYIVQLGREGERYMNNHVYRNTLWYMYMVERSV